MVGEFRATANRAIAILGFALRNTRIQYGQAYSWVLRLSSRIVNLRDGASTLPEPRAKTECSSIRACSTRLLWTLRDTDCHQGGQ